ncbi:MAG: hypothetical protein HOG12_09845 [Alphaproteobacteria bacterium]|nr:hypothetical protein [Alphaproteobacteria bacterium]MBT5160893.1 hypothetical protein [Alphaproteobacteria bacterium]
MKNRPVLRTSSRVVFTLCLMVAIAACASRPEQSVMGDYVPLTSTGKPTLQAVGSATPEPVAKSEPVKSSSIKPLPPKPLPPRLVSPEPVPTRSVMIKPEPAKQIARKSAALPQNNKPIPVAPTPPPLLTSTDVLGLGPTKVSGLLGDPKMIRREKPAEVWQYAGADCVLHVFLYDDEPSGTFRVDHLEATDLQGSKAPTDTCLAGLIKK